MFGMTNMKIYLVFLMRPRSVKYPLLISVLLHQKSTHMHILKNSLMYTCTNLPKFKIHRNIEDKTGVC